MSASSGKTTEQAQHDEKKVETTKYKYEDDFWVVILSSFKG